MDFDRYVGIPWVSHACGPDGANCWGLVRLIYRIERGIDLPSFSDRYTNEEDEADIATLIEGERARWDEIAAGCELTFDVVVLRTRGRDQIAAHVGLIVNPGLVLHVSRGQSSRIERYRGIAVGQRVHGFYRYRE